MNRTPWLITAVIAAVTALSLAAYQFRWRLRRLARRVRIRTPRYKKVFIWTLITILASVAVAAAILAFNAPPSRPREVPRDDHAALLTAIRRCCEDRSVKPADSSSRPSILLPVSLALPFFVAGLWLVRTRDGKVPGSILLTVSGLVTLGGLKLLPIDKLLDTQSLVRLDIETLTIAPRRDEQTSLPITVQHRYDQRVFKSFTPGRSDEAEPPRQGAPELLADLRTSSVNICRRQPAFVVLVGSFDRRELRKDRQQYHRTNWQLAQARADFAAQYFRKAGCQVLAVASFPRHEDASSTEDEMRSDRSVTAYVVHSNADVRKKGSHVNPTKARDGSGFGGGSF